MGTGGFSKRTLCALGAFGLTTDDLRARDAHLCESVNAIARELHANLAGGQIAMVRGASGTGKSTLLRALVSRVRSSGALVVEVEPPKGALLRRRVVDALAPNASEVFRSLAVLAAAGLGDASICARRVGELSDGQRARFAIARAMMTVESGAENGQTMTVVVDELAGTLDDATGRGVCAAISRWVRATPGVRLVAASARRDVATWLSHALAVDLDAHPPAVVARDPSCDPTDALSEIEILRGTFDDYLRLSRLHYRAGRPATCVRVLTARAKGVDGPVGVLTVSMPTLNGAWRAMAWPGEYDRGCSARERAASINRDLRCISRVIVEPRFRARAIGKRLVQAYLAEPLTRRTEAVAAMGAACPMFLRAGMREWAPPPARRDSRLLDVIDRAGLRPWMLVDVAETLELIARERHLLQALRTWANAHGPTRHLVGASARDLVRAAARSVIVRPRAYTAERVVGG